MSNNGILSTNNLEILDLINCAVIKLSYSKKEFKLLYFNEYFSKLCGYSKDDLINCSFDKLKNIFYFEDSETFFTNILNSNNNESFTSRIITKQGTLVWLSINVTQVYNKEENETNFLCSAYDVSSYKKNEHDISLINNLYKKIIQNTSQIPFEIDLQNNILINYSSNPNSFIPKRIADFPNSILKFNILEPVYAKEIVNLYDEVKEGKKKGTLAIKLSLPSKNHTWIKVSYETIFNNLNTPVSVIGTVSDITDQKELEYRFEKEKQYKQAILSNAIFVSLFNVTTGKIINFKNKDGFEYDVSDNMVYDKQTIDFIIEYIHPDEKEYMANQISRATLLKSYEIGERTVECEFRLKLLNQKDYMWIKLTVNLILDSITKNIMCFNYAHNITVQKNIELKLLNQAEIDDMTGIYNKTALKTKINYFFKNELVSNSIQAFCLLNLNCLKLINDTFGHDAGDKVLKYIAGKLKKTLHSQAIIGRICGDEFAILIKNLKNNESINSKVNTVCNICKNINITGVDTSELSCNIGIAISPTHGTSFENLYKKAEKALYYAKNFGRNKISIYNSSMNNTNNNLNPMIFLDPLTGTINFDKFREDASIEMERNPDQSFVLYYADIKQFRYINDCYGYETGDYILKKISKIIHDELNERELFSRIVSNTFIVLTVHLNKNNLDNRLSQVLNNIRNIHELQTLEYTPEVSLGYVIINSQNKYLGINRLIDQAMLAHKNAKKIEGTSVIQYSELLEEKERTKYKVIREIKDAIVKKEICTFVQPQYDVIKQKFTGMEALVRWIHPKKGLIPPNDFIPICEEHGIISEIDFYVLEQICVYLQEKIITNPNILTVAINQSRKTIHKPNYINRVLETVDKYKIPHHLIEFEVTESAYITNNAKTVFILNQLKDHGFSISMDDFGSGYSSLNFLKDMPVDVLKIDRLFLKAGINDFKLRAIIKSIVTMAHEIDITLVCEGVETEEQLKFLEEIGCEVAQGYYFAKPMPVADVEHFIKTFK